MHWDYIKQQHFEFFKIKINRTFCSQLPHHDLHYYTDGLQNKNKVNSEQVLCNSKNNILRGWFCDELLNMTYQEVNIISQALHADEDVELGEHLSITCKSVKLNSHCGNQCGCSSGNGNFLCQDPAIPLLGIYLKDASSCHRETCSTMFICFSIQNNQK